MHLILKVTLPTLYLQLEVREEGTSTNSNTKPNQTEGQSCPLLCYTVARRSRGRGSHGLLQLRAALHAWTWELTLSCV